MNPTLRLLTLCLLATAARGSEPSGRGADAPVRLGVSPRLSAAARELPVRDEGLGCCLDEGRPAVRTFSVRRTPLLVLFDLVLRIDEYFDGPGTPPSAAEASGVLRLSLVSPEAPFPMVNREPQDEESLSVYVLELGELGVTATARQQGRGGFWGDLVAGPFVTAHATGLLTHRGDNASGAYWFATHLLEVRSSPVQPRLPGAPALFAFLSLENGLTRDMNTFQRLSALPGAGLGLSWVTAAGLRLTLTTGANLGPWFDLHDGSARPGYSIGLQSLTAQL